MPSLKPHGQMSEAFITALFLSVSGGLQDVYTYLYRGKVFANAQTGNIVLMAVKLFAGKWGEALRYLIPLCAFALGIFVAEFIRLKLKRMQWLHWRQLVVLFEILMLFVVGFLPQELNLLANSLVSFSCAMQVQSFRKVNGYAFASTMCIGNLRGGAALMLCGLLAEGETAATPKPSARRGTTSPSSSCSRWVPALAALHWPPWAAGPSGFPACCSSSASA